MGARAHTHRAEGRAIRKQQRLLKQIMADPAFIADFMAQVARAAAEVTKILGQTFSQLGEAFSAFGRALCPPPEPLRTQLALMRPSNE
jgi:hypothetical protein